MLSSHNSEPMVPLKTRQHYRSIRLNLLLMVLPIIFCPSIINPELILSGHRHFSSSNAISEATYSPPKNPLHSDPALLLYPLQEKAKQTIANGRPPLWNTDIYGGAPLLANGQAKIFSPSTILSPLATRETATEFEQWFILFVLSSGFFHLARQVQLSTFSALVSASCALAMPFMYIWIHHPIALAACWFPWLIVGVLQSNLTKTALITAFILLSGHPGTSLHVFALASVVFISKPTVKSFIGFVLGMGLSALLWLPQLAFVLESESVWSRGDNHLHFATILDIFWPQLFGHPSTDNFRGPDEWASSQLHIGFPCLYLVLVGLLQSSSRRQSLPIVFGVLIAALISIVGLPGPVNHTRLIGLALMSLCIPAALGAQHIQSKLGQMVILLSIIGLGHWTNRHHTDVIPQHKVEPIIAPWAITLAEDLDCTPNPSNCGRFIGLDNHLIPNTASLAQLRDLRGYDLPVSRQTRRLMAALRNPPQSPWFPIETPPPKPLLLFANVRAIVFEPKNIQWLEQESPRAWFTQCHQSVSRPQEALQMISDVDLRSCPPVEIRNGNPTAPRSVIPIPVSEPYAEKLMFDISNVGEGLVVIGDSFDEGWRATVDGISTPIYRAGGFARAVMVPSDGKTLIMTYEPASWVWGLRISLFAIICLIGQMAWVHIRPLWLSSGPDNAQSHSVQ